MLPKLKLSFWSVAVGAVLASLVGANLNLRTQSEINRIVIDAQESPVFSTRIPPKRVLSETETMRRIAWCESKHRQWDASGNVLRGPDGHDSGYYQIRETVHRDDAERLGFDIYTLDGNVGYAHHLMETQGYQPWYSSQYCWSDVNVLIARAYPF